ncbi:hypothetical protein HWD12_gp158 [Phage NBSal003]|uniref:Uncharacterized protein n=1 Tax=Phage NBSal003 TaxID=2991864 RepID=A0A6G8QZ22_9CAUD|nr:hypothetical protein HWD12_gp158 [Phage NBSal003]QIN92876.1 hypothetical protein [Phage NBSal003]
MTYSGGFVNYKELDLLANKFTELSDNVVSKDSNIDNFITEYREGIISKQELLDKTYKYLKGFS